MATGTSSPPTAEPVSQRPEGGDETVLALRNAVRRVRGMLSAHSGGRLLADELSGIRLARSVCGLTI